MVEVGGSELATIPRIGNGVCFSSQRAAPCDCFWTGIKVHCGNLTLDLSPPRFGSSVGVMRQRQQQLAVVTVSSEGGNAVVTHIDGVVFDGDAVGRVVVIDDPALRIVDAGPLFAVNGDGIQP